MPAPSQATEPSPRQEARILTMDSFHLGKRLNLETCSRAFVDRLLESTKAEMSLRLGEGTVHLFSFGSVVFVGVESSRVEVFLKELSPFVEEPATELVSDDFQVEIRPEAREAVTFDRVVLTEASPRKIGIAAMVMAQSTTLEQFEKTVDGLMIRAAAVTDGMAAGGRVPMSQREMIRFIGVGLSTRRQIVSRLSILDAPDLVWEDSALDRLFHDLKNNFELSTRFRSLEYKLRLIHESVEVIVDLTNTRRTTLLELTIIGLIALEIVMAVMGFFK